MAILTATAAQYTKRFAVPAPHGYLWSSGVTATASNDWVSASFEGLPMPTPSDYKPPKRLMFWGKADEVEGEELQRKVKMSLDFLKGGLSDKQKEKYSALAEVAFRLACGSSELGMDEVTKQFEEKMNRYLKRAAIFTADYNVFIDKDSLEAFTKGLPSNRRLVIDPVEEYEKPLPKRVQAILKRAQKAECFDSFWVFWLKEVKDPILYGKIEEDDERYYYITEWGRDIKIDDFIQSELEKEFEASGYLAAAAVV